MSGEKIRKIRSVKIPSRPSVSQNRCSICSAWCPNAEGAILYASLVPGNEAYLIKVDHYFGSDYDVLRLNNAVCNCVSALVEAKEAARDRTSLAVGTTEMNAGPIETSASWRIQ